jgi:FKBP-type peptidyl-prolyl cis-trans isomerase
MPRTGMFLALLIAAAFVGCENPQTVTESGGASTPSAPAVQQASSSMPKDFQTTPSGLKHKIVREGDDSTKPSVGETVLVHYKGWLDDGTIFDSSYDRGEPLSFPLKGGPGGVIDGWVEGLQLIGEGGEVELEIPGDLGYGPQGMPPAGIGPNATLHFKVELIEVR